MPDESYQLIYLSHVMKDKRHFWALFIEATKEIQFFVANPVATAKTQQSINLVSQF